MTGPIRGERVKKTPDKFKDIKDQYTFDPDQKQNSAKKIKGPLSKSAGSKMSILKGHLVASHNELYLVSYK